MKTIRILLTQVAVDPSKLEQALQSIHPYYLDMNLDTTFTVGLVPQDIKNIASNMNVEINDEQAERVLNILLDGFNMEVGFNTKVVEYLIDHVLSISV